MVIDASVLVSYFVPADVFHAETVTWLDAALNSGERFVAPMLLLPEVAGAIARRSLKPEVGLKAAQETLTWPTLRLLPLDDMLMQLAMGIAATSK